MKLPAIQFGRRRILVLGVSVLSVVLVAFLWLRLRAPRITCEDEFDIALVGGEIIDGRGGEAFKADLGISKGRVACIGVVDTSKAHKILDITGLSASPGFIDVHTHVERNVPKAGAFLAANFVRQGVTTVITGNCGRSFLDIADFFKLLENNRTEINVATLIGHNTVRFQVMKESAAPPSPGQLNRMKGLVNDAMRDGALGLSTGLEYIPGAFARTDELVELAKTARETGGLYASHLRDESTKGKEAILEAINIGERAGIHVHISHFKAQGPNQWGSANQRLTLLEMARVGGLQVSLDQYPYAASSTGLIVLLPSWISEGGMSVARQKLREPATRKRVRDEMLTHLRAMGWRDYSFARVAYCESDHSLMGMNIPEITLKRAALLSRANQNPTAGLVRAASVGSNSETEVERQADTIIDLYTHGGAQMVFFNMDEGDVQTIMRTPEVMFGSDSGVREERDAVLPHPRGSGTFPKVIGAYAREKHLFSIEEAIRRMTSLPATTFGLKGRGELRPGYWADVVVFDRNNIIDTATYAQPLNPPEGIRYVLVNGEVVLGQGYLTQATPGMPIRRTLQ